MQPSTLLFSTFQTLCCCCVCFSDEAFEDVEELLSWLIVLSPGIMIKTFLKCVEKPEKIKKPYSYHEIIGLQSSLLA